MATHYDLLGTEPNANYEEIPAAYRRLIERIHPDQNRVNPAFERLAQEVNKAYAALSDRQRRAAYDRKNVRTEGRRGRAGLRQPHGNNRSVATELEFNIA